MRGPIRVVRVVYSLCLFVAALVFAGAAAAQSPLVMVDADAPSGLAWEAPSDAPERPVPAGHAPADPGDSDSNPVELEDDSDDVYVAHRFERRLTAEASTDLLCPDAREFSPKAAKGGCYRPPRD